MWERIFDIFLSLVILAVLASLLLRSMEIIIYALTSGDRKDDLNLNGEYNQQTHNLED